MEFYKLRPWSLALDATITWTGVLPYASGSEINLNWRSFGLSAALTKQEGRAVAGNHRAMRDACTESLHVILGQRSEQKEH